MAARTTVARVTLAVLTLGQLAVAGDKQAVEQLEAMAAVLPEPR